MKQPRAFGNTWNSFQGDSPPLALLSSGGLSSTMGQLRHPLRAEIPPCSPLTPAPGTGRVRLQNAPGFPVIAPSGAGAVLLKGSGCGTATPGGHPGVNQGAATPIRHSSELSVVTRY